ncbi:hypothetical protein TYRP_008102 [Tyrophagus putrescentiae]|nr:hypothetical protein TYRP_008102 [Tyrophagus putrescentiae]
MFTMMFWSLAVGPLCTAVVLAGAALRWSPWTVRELWAKLCQLTKTYAFALYLCLVVLWLGVVYLTRQLMNEFEHVISTILPLSADVISWGSSLEEQQRLALAGIIIIVLLMLIIFVIVKQPSGIVRAGTVNLSVDLLDELQFPVWEKELKYVLGKEKSMAAIESKLADSDERNQTAYRLIVKTVPRHLAGSVLTTDSAFEAFKNLKEKYGVPSWEQLQMLKDKALRQRLTNFEGENVDKLVKTVVSYETQLRLAGQKVDSSEMVFLLSNSLPRDIDRVNAFADGLRANPNFDHAQMVFRRQCQQWHEEGVLSAKNISSYFVCPFSSGDYILDSGSSNHHIVDLKKFDCFSRQEESVTVANGAESQVLGTGDARLCTPQGVVPLEKAKLTPGFGVNLISVRQLTKAGFTVIFNEKMARVCLNGSVVLTAPVINGLYVYNESANVAMMCRSTAEELHARFGHPGRTKTRELKKMFPEWSFEPVENCDTCIMANQRQQTYKSTNNNCYEPLEVIHMDICDSKGRGFDGSYYYLLVSDEATKFAWTFATLFPNGLDYIQQGGKLHTFGCLAYRWIHQERRNIQRSSKFAPNSEKLVFTGYDASDNNLMILLDPKTDRIYREKNVKIVDKVLPFCEKARDGPCKCLVKERTESPAVVNHEITLDLQVPIHVNESAVEESEEQLSDETVVKTLCEPTGITTENKQTSVSSFSEQTQHEPPTETFDSSLDYQTAKETSESETEDSQVEANTEEMTIEKEETLQGEESEKDDPPESDDEPDDSWITEKQKERRQRDTYNLRDRSQIKPPNRLTYLIQGPSGELMFCSCLSTLSLLLSLSLSIFPSIKFLSMFTMMFWSLAVGPLCTAVVLAGAALRWSPWTVRELWAKLCQLTKTYAFALYLCLVVLWLGVVYLTRQLMNEFEQMV